MGCRISTDGDPAKTRFPALSLSSPSSVNICEHLCHLWIKTPSPDRKRAGPGLAAKRRKKRKKDRATELSPPDRPVRTTLQKMEIACGHASCSSVVWAVSAHPCRIVQYAFPLQKPGRFIFISGIGYGWKQWVSDGFWQAVALGDPDKLSEAQASIFLNRITYEDNAQYYLIWSALAQRAGRQPDATLVRQSFDFIRLHSTA